MIHSKEEILKAYYDYCETVYPDWIDDLDTLNEICENCIFCDWCARNGENTRGATDEEYKWMENVLIEKGFLMSKEERDNILDKLNSYCSKLNMSLDDCDKGCCVFSDFCNADFFAWDAPDKEFLKVKSKLIDLGWIADDSKSEESDKPEDYNKDESKFDREKTLSTMIAYCFNHRDCYSCFIHDICNTYPEWELIPDVELKDIDIDKLKKEINEKINNADKDVSNNEEAGIEYYSYSTSPYESVDGPSHYNGTDCIENMRKLYGDEAVKYFCLCNAYKYNYRAGKKPGSSMEEDIKKSQWYYDYLIKLIKGETDEE